MAGIDASIPLQGKRPDMMGRISDLMGIKSQQLQQQGMVSANQQAAAQASQAQQDVDERAAATDILKNQEKYGLLDANGVTDPAKAIPAILKAAPKTGGQYIQPIMDGFRAQLEVSQAAQTLSKDIRTQVNGSLAAVATDPNATYGDIVSQAALLKEQNPGSAAAVDALLSHLDPKQPMEVTKHKLTAFGRAVLGPSELVGPGGLATPTPSVIDTGARLELGATDKQTGAFTSAGQSVKKEISPGYGMFTDPRDNNPYRFNSQTGSVTPLAGVTTPPQYAGQERDRAQQQQDVQNIRATADQAPLNRSIYQHILKLSDEADTGKFVSKLMGNSVISQMFGDKYQELNKYLEKNAIANMQAMGGPPSDARLSAAAAANGGTDFNPEALKAVTRFNYATNTALEKFREGIDKALGTQNPDYAKLPQFKADWAKNFDVNVFILENALRDKNPKVQAALLNGLSKEQAAELAQKRRNLTSLAEKGRLP